MARTYKDKPRRAKDTKYFPFGYRTRWNDCGQHGKLCCQGSVLNRKSNLKRREVINNAD